MKRKYKDKPKDKSVKTVNEWMGREDLPDGFTIANAKFRHEYSRLWRSLRKQAALLYFIGVDMGNRYVTKMMYSASKQAHFCGAVMKEMEHKEVDVKHHVMVFEEDTKQIKKRIETIERITKEDIHLTEYEPFFIAEGYDALDNMDFKFEDLKQKADKWNEAHREEVEVHMKAVQPEIDRHNEFLRQKREKIKAEKASTKQAKKEQKAYEDEIIKNRKKNRKEYLKVERTFERYYEGRA